MKQLIVYLFSNDVVVVLTHNLLNHLEALLIYVKLVMFFMRGKPKLSTLNWLNVSLSANYYHELLKVYSRHPPQRPIKPLSQTAQVYCCAAAIYMYVFPWKLDYIEFLAMISFFLVLGPLWANPSPLLLLVLLFEIAFLLLFAPLFFLFLFLCLSRLKSYLFPRAEMHRRAPLSGLCCERRYINVYTQ